ncbi:MAG TPA: aminodeoxychorismate/anthranilate synthase component II [Gemmatimonadales bacterium]|jgi:anthranilate synthase component 2
MILVIDNYDSFVYNLVQYLGELDADPVVYRNDAITVAQAVALRPEGIVVSPGPGVPVDAGISVDLIRAAAPRCPILGVCLGHQALGEAFGARIVRAPRLMHGKTSAVHHDGSGLFADLASPLVAMRYHSLVVDRASLPPDLVVNAWTADPNVPEEIMGMRHESLPLHGVQFHPESIGTGHGRALVRAFMAVVRDGAAPTV